jgi:hypothetical protein
MEDTFGRHISEVEIWKAAFNKDFFPRTAQFLWKSLHSAHRVGKYWNPNVETALNAKIAT